MAGVLCSTHSVFHVKSNAFSEPIIKHYKFSQSRDRHVHHQHGCSNHSNLKMEAECLMENLPYLNLIVSRTKNGILKLHKLHNRLSKLSKPLLFIGKMLLATIIIDRRTKYV